MPMITTVTFTRAELVAAQMAIGLMWIEHQHEQHDPQLQPLHSALIKLNTVLQTWDGEIDAELIWQC
jgi:hypothetical protein